MPERPGCLAVYSCERMRHAGIWMTCNCTDTQAGEELEAWHGLARSFKTSLPDIKAFQGLLFSEWLLHLHQDVWQQSLERTMPHRHLGDLQLQQHARWRRAGGLAYSFRARLLDS